MADVASDQQQGHKRRWMPRARREVLAKQEGEFNAGREEGLADEITINQRGHRRQGEAAAAVARGAVTREQSTGSICGKITTH